jgi:hypothetical protein
VVSGDLRLPRGPAGQVRPSKAKPTSKVPWKGSRARRGTAATSHPLLHLLHLPEGPTTRRTKTRSFSAAGGLQSDRANPSPIPGEAIFRQNSYFYIFWIFWILLLCIFCIFCIFLLLKIQHILHFIVLHILHILHIVVLHILHIRHIRHIRNILIFFAYSTYSAH